MSLSFFSSHEVAEYLRIYYGKKIEFRNKHFFSLKEFATKFEAEQLVFINCTFEQTLRISNKRFENGISFSDCTFLHGLELFNIGYFNKEKQSSISLNSCISHGEVLIQDCDQVHFDIQVKIEKGMFNFIKNICLHELKIKDTHTNTLAFKDSSLGSISITSLHCKHLFFDSNHFNKLFIEDSSLHFSDLSIFNSLNKSIANVNQYSIHFNNCTLIDSHFNLTQENEEEAYVEFKNINFKGECSIFAPLQPQSEFPELEPNILNKKLSYQLDLVNNNSTQPISIGSFDFHLPLSVYIGSAKNNNCTYEISDITVSALIFRGDCSNTIFELNRIEIDKSIEFVNFIGSEKTKLSNIKSAQADDNAIIIFRNADLSRVKFSDINFNEFKTIHIKSSQFRSAVFENVKWFDIKNVYFGYDLKGNSKQYFKDCRSLFNQLKQSSEKNDDKLAALNFHSLEEKNHLNELISSPNLEMIRLYLKSTNDFGNNWIRPIFLLIALSIITSYLLLYFSNKDLFAMFYSYFPNLTVQLLNPTHSFKEIVESSNGVIKHSFINNLIDILHKTFTTFLIFQTITAFRRQHT